MLFLALGGLKAKIVGGFGLENQSIVGTFFSNHSRTGFFAH
jgi:hypothetical protein